MIRLPNDPEGYNVEGNVLHTRYATHAKGQRTRTKKGALTLLDGRKPKLCADCYPSPQYDTPAPRPAQKRRKPDAAALS